MADDLIEALARRFAAQENEIWEEAPQSYRKRWMREARAAIARAERSGGE